jgi:hypothetical protein
MQILKVVDEECKVKKEYVVKGRMLIYLDRIGLKIVYFNHKSYKIIIIFIYKKLFLI